MDEKIPDYYLVYGMQSDYPESPEISEVERITNAFEAHESQEGKFTEQYKEIAEKLQSSLARFLLELIISDEEKHQAVTHAIVSTLKSGLSWTKSPDAITGLYDLGKDREQLLSLTEGFIRLEREGIREYKKLIQESKHYYQGLFSLLLELMIRDSEKHVAILEFLRQRVKEA